MKKLLAYGLLLITYTSAHAFNMAYVEVNTNSIQNTACYIRSDTKQPFFGAVSIFAANINGQSPDSPEIYFNDNVVKVLNSNQIDFLHKNGIKVLMTLLGNHQNAGWDCMTDPVAATKFANDIVNMVNQYHLDGVDIDDEYSTCAPNHYSMIMIAAAIKNNPQFAGKLLTKALFDDYNDFTADYNGHHLSEYLDYGWEMSYGDGNFQHRLAFYLKNGMAPDFLMIGGWAAMNSPDPFAIAQFALKNGLAGNMVYDITSHSQDYLTKMIQAENNQLTVDVVPGCLQ